MSRSSPVLTLALLASLLAACGAPGAEPTLPPVAVTVYLAGTPTAQVTRPPTASLPAGAATATAAAGLGTGPAADATTAAPTSVPVYGPDSYPDNVNPLTGQVVDPARLNRMPVAVKISNFPYSVRPQSGLSLADLVFEHTAEAGLTRFTAVYLQNDGVRLGSIRSARYIDTEIAPIFGALLVTSGSSLGTMDHLRRSAWFAGDNVWRLVSEESRYSCPPLCREQPDDMNTLFTSTEAVRAATAARGSGQRSALAGLAFSETPPAGAPVSEVLVDFSAAARVSWRYNPVARLYDRWQERDSSGELIAHIDALTSTPITAANVVVLYVNHVNNFVPEDFRDGGNCGQEIQLWTLGPARIFRDGVMLEATWRRDASTGMRLRLVDSGERVIPLRPGSTWFDVVGLTANSTLAGTTFGVQNKVLDTKTSCPVPPTETPTPTPEGFIPAETPSPMP